MQIVLCQKHCAFFRADKGTLSSFPRNLRCFAADCDMSLITRFLCYFFSLKFASVLFFSLFPSLGAPSAPAGEEG